MALFNWSKSDKTRETKGPAEHPYYGARVRVVGETITVNNNHGEKKAMRFDEVSRISVVSYADKNPEADFWLYFWPFTGGGSLSVPSKAGGFSQLITALESFPGFDKQKYLQLIKGVTTQHRQVYKSDKVPTTAELTSGNAPQAFEKIEEGLWLEDRQELLPWGSFADLEQVKGVKRTKEFPPNPKFRQYAYALRDITVFNGLKLETLNCRTPGFSKQVGFNKQWPTTDFWTSIVLGKSGKETFDRLSAHFTKHWQNPTEDGEITKTWKQDRVLVRLTCFKSESFRGYNRDCSLTITITPDLSAFFTGEYQQQLQLSSAIQYKVLPASFGIDDDYTKNTNVFYTPNCFDGLLKPENQALIWVDEQQQKIGFANAKYCRILDLSEVKHLHLTAHYWRDKLTGYSLVYNNKRNRNWQSLVGFYPTEDYSVEDFLQQLKTYTGITCTQSEDRQYY